MSNILVIGAGGVSSVTIHKMAMLPNIFTKITLASRTLKKCIDIQINIKKKYNININVVELDADNINDTVEIIKQTNPFLVLNLALPYQDLNIMDACLITNTHYIDTANYEPIDEAKFEYSWQWNYKEKFEKKGFNGSSRIRL